MATLTTITGAAFDQLPYEAGSIYELLEGEMIEVASETPERQQIVNVLNVSLGIHLEEHRLGVVHRNSEFVIGKDSRLRPDVAVIFMERWATLDRRQSPIAFAPDIAVDIVSESDFAVHSQGKVYAYLAAGTQEVWQLWPASQRIFIYRGAKSISPLGTEDVLSTPMLPGWELPVREILEALS
jgi:Uma2 family endonuclease